MQGRAIFEAAVRASRRGIDVKPEIMVPLVSDVAEFDNQRAILEETRSRFSAVWENIDYLIGTMIELPALPLPPTGLPGRRSSFPSEQMILPKRLSA
jgi:pyruvate,orthophosphate dikinase